MTTKNEFTHPSKDASDPITKIVYLPYSGGEEESISAMDIVDTFGYPARAFFLEETSYIGIVAVNDPLPEGEEGDADVANWANFTAGWHPVTIRYIDTDGLTVLLGF